MMSYHTTTPIYYHGLAIGEAVSACVCAFDGRYLRVCMVDGSNPPNPTIYTNRQVRQRNLDGARRVLGQAIGRWGNFFNSEAFGLPTDLPWKLHIPITNRPPEFLGELYFHPTFLYESLWNLGVCTMLLLVFRAGVRGRIQLPAGALSCLYLMAYSTGRVWIEGLRLDPLCLVGVPPFCSGGLRMAQLMSLVLIALGAIGLWWLYGRRRSLPDPSGVPV